MTHQTTTRPGPPSISARLRSWLAGVDGGTGAARAAVDTGRALRADRSRRLRDHWKARSLATCWISPGDWWSPACDAVVECLVEQRDPVAAIGRLGHVRAELGCTIEEALDDLTALYHSAGGQDPPLQVVRALVAGWADAGLRGVGTASCLDPSTGLATRAFLEARLAEIYRDGRPGHPADSLCLVVVDLDVPVALPAVPVLCRLSEVLRRTFTHGHTIARISQGRFLALAPVGTALPGQLRSLEAQLGDQDQAAAVIWTESLPRTFALVRALLDDLAR